MKSYIDGRIVAKYDKTNPDHCCAINIEIEPMKSIFSGENIDSVLSWLCEQIYANHEILDGKKVRVSIEVIEHE